LAAYLMAAHLAQPEIAVFVIDPQGQFTSEEGLPFSLQEWAEEQGRDVLRYSIASDLRLQQNAYLLSDLLGETRFFRDILTLRTEDPRESAQAEFIRLLQGTTHWDNLAPDDLLRALLTALLADTQALTRIYASASPRARLVGRLQAMLGDATQFQIAL